MVARKSSRTTRQTLSFRVFRVFRGSSTKGNDVAARTSIDSSPAVFQNAAHARTSLHRRNDGDDLLISAQGQEAEVRRSKVESRKPKPGAGSQEVQVRGRRRFAPGPRWLPAPDHRRRAPSANARLLIPLVPRPSAFILRPPALVLCHPFLHSSPRGLVSRRPAAPHHRPSPRTSSAGGSAVVSRNHRRAPR